jgi:hypothetical protein
MDFNMVKEINERLLKDFRSERKRAEITNRDICKEHFLEYNGIVAWAWCTGMGSDAYILLLKNNGTLLEYNHYKYSDDFNEFAEIQQHLLEKKESWLLYRCNFINNFYICPEFKAWFDKCWKAFVLPNGNPYVCIEYICQSIEKKKKRISKMIDKFHKRECSKELSLNEARNLSAVEIRAWCHYVGHFDSCDEYIFITKNGTILFCDLSYKDDDDAFEDSLICHLLKKDDWINQYCAMGNNIYFRNEDEWWLKKLIEHNKYIERHPFFFLECICRKISKEQV